MNDPQKLPKLVKVNCPTIYLHGYIGEVVRQTECEVVVKLYGQDFVLASYLVEPV